MACSAFPSLAKSPRRDPFLLALGSVAWLPAAWLRPGAEIAALFALATTLLLCKWLAIPPLQSVANSPDFLAPEGIPKHDAQVFLDATKYMRLQQIPREPEWNRLLPDQVNRCIQLGELTPMQAFELLRQWREKFGSK